jgi:hypothetical protein
VECATFADQLKEIGQKWQNNWHFIDTPYLDQGGNLNDYPQFKYDPDNIVKAIGYINDWLLESGNYKSNFVYKNITSRVNGTDEQKSFALRLLIHYVGDLHQPLHATARINP